jgi:uncharacterized protein YidB (DUF937 family)
LLAFAALALVAVVIRVNLAQQRAAAATPEPTVAQVAASTLNAQSGQSESLQADELETSSDTVDMGLVASDTVGMGFVAGDTDFSLLARLADIIRITPDELRAAIDGGQTLTQVATANGMSRQELIDALLTQELERLALAATTGVLSQAQVDFIQGWLVDVVEMLVDHPLPIGPAWWDVFAQDWQALFDAEDYDLPDRLAQLLGLELEELVRALLDGQPPAEIARANNVDPQIVIQFLVAEAEAELDEGVAAGYLTDEQAQVLLGWVEGGVVRVMDNAFFVPDAVELAELLQSLFGPYFKDTLLDELDWGKWLTFDWAKFVGQDPLSVTADRIGISRGALLEALSKGQSLSQIAEARGVDTQVLDDARIASVTAILDELVSQGLIPSAELDRFKQVVGPRVWMVVEHDFSFKYVIKTMVRYANDACGCWCSVPLPSEIVPAGCGAVKTIARLIGAE